MIPLVRHPDTSAGKISALEARLERVQGGAVATFVAFGDIRMLTVPPASDAVRTDGLWRTTCFELFVGGGGEAYREINLSPSGAWAAYDFDSYRQGMRECEADILIRTDRDDERFILVANIRADIAPFVPVGLTAVIEETDGAVRYWATSFAPGKPDFHAPGVRSLLLDDVEAE